MELYNIPNYNMFAKCNKNYRAGGVLCYLDQDMVMADCFILNIRVQSMYFKSLAIYINDFITGLDIN